MTSKYRAIAVILLTLCGTASAQVQRPVQSTTILRNAITGSQARELSVRIDDRPAAATLTLDPGKVRAAAGAQAIPVDISGSRVVPTTSDPSPPHPADAADPVTSLPARVELLRTTPSDERLLRRAIAAQDGLHSALSVRNSSLITLPGVVRMSASEGPELKLKQFILVNRPLQRGDSGYFEGELLVGVTEIVDTELTRQLPVPLLFEIVGAVKSVPERILVETTSPPFRRVRVMIDAVENRAARLLIVSVIDRKGTEISLPLVGELTVDSASASLEGLGIETTKVNVALTGVANPKGRKVILRADPAGYLEPSVVTLDADGTAQSELRSAGLGKVVIKATTAELRPATVPVNYGLPVRTLGGSLLGAFLGAAASFLTSSRRDARPLRRIVGSAIFGVIVFALYAVGVNVLPVAPTVTVGAVLVFAVSAVGAFIGPSLLPNRNRASDA